jgi:hypothetical protein
VKRQSAISLKSFPSNCQFRQTENTNAQATMNCSKNNLTRMNAESLPRRNLMKRHGTSIVPYHSAISDSPGWRYGKKQFTSERVRHRTFKAGPIIKKAVFSISATVGNEFGSDVQTQ